MKTKLLKRLRRRFLWSIDETGWALIDKRKFTWYVIRDPYDKKDNYLIITLMLFTLYGIRAVKIRDDHEYNKAKKEILKKYGTKI